VKALSAGAVEKFVVNPLQKVVEDLSAEIRKITKDNAEVEN